MPFLWIETSSAYSVSSMHTEGSPPLSGNSQLSGKPNRDEEPNEDIEDDNLYCLQSTFVFFQVEKHLFCVPTYRFVDESHAFTKLFKLPEPNACGVKGSSRDGPIILPDISQRDFHNFLKALYPLAVSTHLKLSNVEWISVLRLSTLWYFLEYRQMAISTLEDGEELKPVDKVRYGREFKLRTWIEEGCTVLVSRDETISKEEAVILGFETTFSLFSLREKRIQDNLDCDATTAVLEAFKDELDLIGLSELEYRTDVDGSSAVVKGEDSGSEDDRPKEAAINLASNNGSTAFHFNFERPPRVASTAKEKKRRNMNVKR